MHALCPHCLDDRELTPTEDPDWGKVLQCERCHRAVPFRYTEDYAAHPPCRVSVMGLSLHGKTTYLRALFHNLEGLETLWQASGFYIDWLDPAQQERVNERLRDLVESGMPPDLTKPVFPEPEILRLRNVPGVGGCQLIFLDTGGEVFLNTRVLMDAGRYLKDSPTVVWLISLKPGDIRATPKDAKLTLTTYLDAMAKLGGRRKGQNLVVVLTKADEFLADLPEPARMALQEPDYSPAGKIWTTLTDSSAALRAWLQSERCGYGGLVTQLDAHFHQVRYCVASSQAGTAEGDGARMKYRLTPRGVLAPLLWLWQFDRKPVRVEGDGAGSTYFNLPTAVAAAAGGTVHLEAGEYRLSAALHVFQSVSIVGRGVSETVLVVSGPVYGIGIRVEGRVVLKGLTVRLAGDSPGDVIRIDQGELDLADVAISGGTRGTWRGTGILGCGLLAGRQARVAATDCTFRGNKGSGLRLIAEAGAEVNQCRFEANAAAGFEARTLGPIDVRDSGFQGNAVGVWILSAGRATLVENKCRQNRQVGMVFEGQIGPSVSARDNTCELNQEAGILIVGSAAPTLVRNSCSENTQDGLVYRGRAAGTARQLVCTKNGRNGVWVGGDAAPLLEGTRVEGNTGCGMLFEGQAAGIARDTFCVGNTGDGVRIATGSPQIDGIEARENGGYGAVIVDVNSEVQLNLSKVKGEKNEKGLVHDPRTRKWWGSRG